MCFWAALGWCLHGLMPLCLYPLLSMGLGIFLVKFHRVNFQNSQFPWRLSRLHCWSVSFMLLTFSPIFLLNIICQLGKWASGNPSEGFFMIAFIDVGRSILTVGEPSPQIGVLGWPKRRSVECAFWSMGSAASKSWCLGWSTKMDCFLN